MDDSESVFSYCPDFSDMCNEDTSFWDFLSNHDNENGKTPNEEGSENFCFVEDSDNLSKSLQDRHKCCNKFEESSGMELSNQKSKPKKISKTGSDSLTFEVPCKKYGEKIIYNEEEDEFWDFLKSDDVSSAQVTAAFSSRPLTSAELEEMRSLSSLTPLSTYESSPTSASEINSFKISNLITPQNEDENRNKSNTLANNGAYCTGFRERISEKFMDTIQSQNAFKSNKQYCNYKDKLKEQNFNSRYKCTVGSNAFNHFPFENNSSGCNSSSFNENNSEVNRIMALPTIPEQSNSVKNVHQLKMKKCNRIFPEISSVFSLSSTNTFLQQKCMTENQDIDKLKNNLNYSTIKSVPASSDTNTIAPHTNDSSSTRSHFIPENKATISCNLNENSSLKLKHTKRLLQQKYSPKNSVFRITDCPTTLSYIQPTEINLPDETINKRQKINDTISDSNANCSESSFSLEKDKKELSAVPVKYIVLPNSTSTLTLGANNGSVSNPSPLYLILPRTVESGNYQNPELVMVVNSNNSLTTNSDMKTSINLTSCTFTVPTVSCSSGLVGNQTSNLGNHTSGIQHIALPAVNVMSSHQNPIVSNASYNYSGSTLLSDSISQSLANDTIKMPSPISTSSTTKINILPSLLPQNSMKTENVSFYSTPMIPLSNINEGIVSQASIPTVSVLKSNAQVSQINSDVHQKKIASSKMFGSFIGKSCHQNMLIPPIRSEAVCLQSFKQVRPHKFKPIKSISLGKDKNAIQQISIPLKMDSLRDPKVLNYVHDNLGTCESPSFLNTFGTCIVQDESNKFGSLGGLQIQSKGQKNCFIYKNGVFNLTQKRNSNGILVKRNLITNETEVINNNNQVLNSQSGAQGLVLNSVDINKGIDVAYLGNTLDTTSKNQEKVSKTAQLSSTGIPNSRILVNAPNETKILPNTSTIKIDSVTSLSQIQPVESSKSTIATLQELFPPPISMIPVSVLQSDQSANNPPLSRVLVLQSANSISNQINKLKSQRKTAPKKMPTTKAKKLGRKTVRQLLEERYKNTTNQLGKVYQPRLQTKVLRPIYKLGANGALISTLPLTDGRSLTINNNTYSTEKSSGIADNIKRPNIMMIPSAAKILESNNLQEDSVKKDDHINRASREAEDTFKFCEPSQESLFEKIKIFKDCKSRSYDMCELCIGYFKFEDGVDSCGRFRSKFKILFTKRQFLYEFPATKCNQVDLGSIYSSEQIVSIQVSFQSLVALDVFNRQINIQVNECPKIILKKTQERSVLTSRARDYFKNSCLLIEAVQNSLQHKIMLRKRQADNLKSCLCQFDSIFTLLFDIGKKTGLTSIVAASPFEEELVSTSWRKICQKNKKNMIRRLPHWDYEDPLDPVELTKADTLLSSNQVCSCRISCKSLRCSCVKAAKSCSTGGTVCQCINCENPLNVLESFGINLDFSLNDTCLFQNIYQIQKLRVFLLKSVKLSCCNTVARVVDCIPGTILCPNTECNESLEFSWCEAVICYPDRNPRNHCSFCGLCCFANKRHCPICNRCYAVSLKCPDCPNCRGTIFAMKPINQEFDMHDSYEKILPHDDATAIKTSSKPEIVVLDSSLNAKMDNSTTKTEGADSLKTDLSPLKSSVAMDAMQESLLRKELIDLVVYVSKAVNKSGTDEIKDEMDEKTNEGNSVKDSKLKDSKVEIDDCKDIKEDLKEKDICSNNEKKDIGMPPKDNQFQESVERTYKCEDEKDILICSTYK